jgi:hypothetical protein
VHAFYRTNKALQTEARKELMNTIQSKYLAVTQPKETVSDKYRFISTAQFVADVEMSGFKLQSIQGRSPSGYGKHLMTFERPDLSLPNGDKIRLLCFTSHDGTKAFNLFLGYYRLVCSNGMMVGKTLESHRVIHTGYALSKVQHALDACLAQVGALKAQVELLGSTDLSVAQETLLANLYAEEVGALEPMDLLTAHREQDIGPNAWLVLNRLQENVVNGNFTRKGSKGEVITARRITGASNLVKTNRDIWDAVVNTVSYKQAA